MAKRRGKMAIQNRVVELRQVKGRDLLQNPRNWRQHPEAQQAAMEGVLKEVGFAGAILARETPEGLVLIDGHLRAATLPNMLLPVLVLDVTEEEADKILATYDPLSAMAQPDMDALLNLLQTVAFEDKAVADMLEALANGETLPMPDRTGLTDPDDVPPLPEEPYVKLGDLWQLGDHRVLCGDSKEDSVFSEGVVVILTDPPWGLGEKWKGGTWGATSVSSDVLEWDKKAAQDIHIQHLIAMGLPTIIWGGNYFGLSPSRCWLVWDKAQHMATVADCDLAWTNFDRPIKLFTESRNPDGKRLHAGQKPRSLMEWCLGFLPPGIVYDPFLGSGTTLMAAEKLHRICYGMEIEPRYVQVAIERWQDYTGGKAVLLGNHETHRVKP